MIGRLHRAVPGDPGDPTTPCLRIRSRLLRPLVPSSFDPRDRFSLTPAPTAVEMSPPWKSQNDFHRGLEISHRTRDSHIPTSRLSCEEENEQQPQTNTVPLDRWTPGRRLGHAERG
jgi:hypothetical protein